MMSAGLDTFIGTMAMKLRYTAVNNGTLFYQRRWPKAMAAAFPTAMYKRSLQLPTTTPYADVLPAWNEASEEYALMLSMASNTSADVLTQADLDRKAAVWLRAQGLDVGALSEHPHS